MAHGDVSKSKITEKFNKRIDELIEKARDHSDSFRRFNERRNWHTPAGLKDANLLQIPGLHAPDWDRNEINEIYSQLVESAGKEGGSDSGLMQMKIQNDFMAVEERAWRLRHASLVRCACVAHGRLNLHGILDRSAIARTRNLAANIKERAAIHRGNI
jgi:hypothetical protein